MTTQTPDAVREAALRVILNTARSPNRSRARAELPVNINTKEIMT